MTAEAETTVKMFHSLDRDMALEPDGGVQKAKTLPRDSNLAADSDDVNGPFRRDVNKVGA
jgi:hypothetical protein